MKHIALLILLTSLFGCSQLKKYQIEKFQFEKRQIKKELFSVKWSKNLDPIHNAGNLPIGTASPFITEDMLYIGSLSGMMHAYDLESGRTIWQKNERQPINSKAAKFKDSIIYGSKLGRVFSRHYLTGKLNYAIDLGASIESSPVVYAGRMFFHLRNHRIVAMDAATGKIIWSYKRSIPYTTTLQRVSKVMPYENNIIVGFADGYIGALSIVEGVIVWEQKITNKHKFVDVDVEPILFNSNIVVGSANGDLSFINPSNGLLNRSFNIRISSKPIIFGDKILVGSAFGEITSINKDGSVDVTKKVAQDAITSLVLWNGKIVASTMDGKILGVDTKNFNVLGKFELGSDFSTVFGQIEKANEYLAVYSSRNRLYIFK